MIPNLRPLLLATIVLLVIAIIYSFKSKIVPGQYSITQTKPYLSSVDGFSYRVHDVHEHPQQAADTLSVLNNTVIELMRYLRDKYVRGELGNKYPARKLSVRKMLARYNPDNLAENSPKDPNGDTAYSIDKGSIIAICLRSKRTGEIHDLDILKFVTIHEMAHIAINAIDHPPEFWSTFRFLLEDAAEAGIFTSPDYNKYPTEYCGIDVNYNPTLDNTLEPIQ